MAIEVGAAIHECPHNIAVSIVCGSLHGSGPDVPVGIDTLRHEVIDKLGTGLSALCSMSAP